ncbi:MAG: hypothetical protein RLZZ84_676 [Pseudomonadota bacterium]
MSQRNVRQWLTPQLRTDQAHQIGGKVRRGQPIGGKQRGQAEQFVQTAPFGQAGQISGNPGHRRSAAPTLNHGLKFSLNAALRRVIALQRRQFGTDFHPARSAQSFSTS